MRRREFIAGLLLAPTMQRAEAQQSAKPYRIAVVHQSASVAEMSETADNPYYRALFKELRRLGYVEGQNLVVERYSGGGREEFTELSRDVVRTKPDVIVASSSRVVLSFKAATDTIPIVSSLADPVAYGIAASIAHPGGNITGVSVDAGLDIWSKRLQLLHEAVPTLSRVGYLGPQQSWHLPQVRTLEDTARQLQLSFLGPPLESPIEEAEYRRVLDAMTQERVDSVIVGDQLEHMSYQRLILDLLKSARLPAIFPYLEYVQSGGLMAYGSSIADVYRRMAGYVDQILKGAKPGEIPIYLVSKFQLVINLKAAKALGVAVTPSLLNNSDEVIE